MGNGLISTDECFEMFDDLLGFPITSHSTDCLSNFLLALKKSGAERRGGANLETSWRSQQGFQLGAAPVGIQNFQDI